MNLMHRISNATGRASPVKMHGSLSMQQILCTGHLISMFSIITGEVLRMYYVPQTCAAALA